MEAEVSERLVGALDQPGKQARLGRLGWCGRLRSGAFRLLQFALLHLQPLFQADSCLGRSLGLVTTLSLAHLLGHGILLRAGAVVAVRASGIKRTHAMAEARVRAEVWAQAALRLGNAVGRYGAVLRRGDPDAGGILVVLRGRDGLMVLGQMRLGTGELAWMRGTGPAPVDQAAADAYVARQVRIDPDLWVLEFESPDLLPPFEARLV